MEDDPEGQAFEARFLAALYEMKAIWLEACGWTNQHLETLLDVETRASESTLNYLAASASGTLRDRQFAEANGDAESRDGYKAVNQRYGDLLDAASRAASELGYPCVRDWRD